MLVVFRRVLFASMLLRGLIALAADPAAPASLPRETTTKASTSFEILKAGKPSGRLAIPAGTLLTLVDVQDRFAIVQYRNLNGRVPLGDTTLPTLPSTSAGVAVPAPAPIGAADAKSAKQTTDSASGTASSTGNAEQAYTPETVMEQRVAGKLVVLEGGMLRPFAPARLKGVKFYAIYYSAGWCPPCREFTPEFMDAYTKLRAIYPEFETILVNRDRSPAAMFEYMRDDSMRWPALSWDQVRGAKELNAYAGPGIPCLVLVDEKGKVLSDSYRWGRYVGPDAVLEDTWKVLRDYRRQNPRPKKG